MAPSSPARECGRWSQATGGEERGGGSLLPPLLPVATEEGRDASLPAGPALDLAAGAVGGFEVEEWSSEARPAGRL
jgi:hypothetical protein